MHNPFKYIMLAASTSLLMLTVLGVYSAGQRQAADRATIDSLTQSLHEAQDSVKVDTLVLTPWEYRDSLVTQQARKYGVPELLALAVSRVENWRGIPWAMHPTSGAYGLMQVMPLWQGTWPDCGDPMDPMDPEAQACYGVRILGHYLRAHRGDEGKALAAYNGAVTPWKARLYLAQVAERKEELGI